MSRDVALREFVIPFIGLKLGETSFEFEIEDKFFTYFEGSEPITGSDVEVEMVLDKRTSMMVLTFYVEGTIKATCDRCLNEIDQELLDEFTVYVKFSQDADGMDDEEDVIFLQPNETHLDVAHLVYEFVILSIPLQKGCKVEEIGGPQCNKVVLEKLGYFSKDDTDENKGDDNNDDDIDQRWSALKKLK
ncbi:hypothetical protein BH09BAC1_BH09BAC1_20720 [soil metagenome]